MSKPVAYRFKSPLSEEGQPEQEPEQEQEQEPVAWWDGKESVVFMHDEIYTPNWTDYWTQPLYTAPPQRKPLTDEEIIKAIKHISHNEMSAFAIARAIEKFRFGT